MEAIKLPERVTDCDLNLRNNQPILDGNLKLIRAIGSGAQGRVYEALLLNKENPKLSRKILVALKVSKNQGSCGKKQRANTYDRDRFPNVREFTDLVCADSAKLELFAYSVLAKYNLPTIPRVYASTKCKNNRFLMSEFIPHAKTFEQTDDDLLLNSMDFVTVMLLYTIMKMQQSRLAHYDIHSYNVLIQGPKVARNYNAMKSIEVNGQTIDIQVLVGYRRVVPYLIDFGFANHERKDGSLIRGPYRISHYDPEIDIRALAQMLIEWYPKEVTIGQMRAAGTIYTVQFLELLLDDALRDKQLVSKIQLPNAYAQKERFAEVILSKMFLRK